MKEHPLLHGVTLILSECASPVQNRSLFLLEGPLPRSSITGPPVSLPTQPQSYCLTSLVENAK